MLKTFSSKDILKESILPFGAFHPFPKCEERHRWDGLPPRVKEVILAKAERHTGLQWPVLPAAAFMNFKRTGNRSEYERPYAEKRRKLALFVLAECIEDRGRFMDDIINGIWNISEETSWLGPGATLSIPGITDILLPEMEHIFIDLYAGETGALFSWIHYLLKTRLDGVSKRICRRIEEEVRKRILDPYLKHDDFWWMSFHVPEGMHVNNWNPWCNSNCLMAFLILEKDQERRLEAIAKCLRSVDIFLSSYHEDGGCEEGTSYWARAGGSLFDCLELLYEASGGSIDLYHVPKVKEMGRFVYRTHISGDYFVNFADGAPRVKPPAELLFRYGKRIDDQQLINLAIYESKLLGEEVLSEAEYSLYRKLPIVLNYEKMQSLWGNPPYLRDCWMSGIEVMTAREREGSDRGLYLAAKGGHNHESHNHNDIGNFILYSNGMPVIIDVGVETYTAKTFSPQRYEIWTMQSPYHNVPTANGVQQKDGEEYKAAEAKYACDEMNTRLELEIGKAYPEAAGIRTWKRSFHFCREGRASIEIHDCFLLTERTQDLSVGFMTCCEHALDTDGLIVFHGPDGTDVRLEYDAGLFKAGCETIELTDPQLKAIWGERLYRIVLTACRPVREGTSRMGIYQASPA